MYTCTVKRFCVHLVNWFCVQLYSQLVFCVHLYSQLVFCVHLYSFVYTCIINRLLLPTKAALEVIEMKERSDFSCMSRYPTFFPLFPSTCDWLAASFLNPDWLTKLARHSLVPHSFSRQPKSLLSFLSMAGTTYLQSY